jgi:hypothetical protein
MNAKIAKQLRRIARGMVVAAEAEAAPKGPEATGKPLSIKKVAYQQNQKGTISVAKNTYKGAYKALKAGTL